MKKFYSILNLVVIFFLVFWNYWVNTMGIEGNTVGSLSDEYVNLFTPAGYAFSIWGIIFLMLIAHGIYGVKKVWFDKKDDDFVEKIGPWLTITNIANATWLVLWLNEYTLGSVLTMLVILISLLVVILKLNMEKWDAPRPTIFWVWWPICLYSGWIAVATIANISAYLAKMDFNFLFSEITWTIIMILVAVLLNLFMIAARNMREFAGVGVWALVAIAVRHWGVVEPLQWTALIGAIILSIAIFAHGFKNRETSPLNLNRKTP